MLEAKLRSSVGSKSSRVVRYEGYLPASICGEEQPVSHIVLNHKVVSHLYQTDNSFFSKVLKISVDGKVEKVIAKSMQLHPVTDNPIHLQLLRVSENSKIQVSVPVHFLHEDKSPGIKLGGSLNVIVHSLDIICAPQDIMQKIEISLEGMPIHHTIHLKDLNLPASIRPAYPEKDDVVATIVAPAAGADA